MPTNVDAPRVLTHVSCPPMAAMGRKVENNNRWVFQIYFGLSYFVIFNVFNISELGQMKALYVCDNESNRKRLGRLR